MTRVLFLAYHFPPVGGAGVQRSLAFARRLPALGHDVVVVTGPGDGFGPWSPPDPTLAAGLDAIAVRRVAGPVPRGRGRLERAAGRPGAFARWWARGCEALGAAEPGVDVVYASLAPYETAAAAARIARRRGLPWVADLRDPWALDEMVEYPSWLHRRAALAAMERTLRSATAIVVNTEEAARRLRAALPALRAIPLAAIPNGYDAADWTGERPAAGGDAVRIVHTGALHTAQGLARRRPAGRVRRALGGAAPVDPLTRSHVHLVRAIERVEHHAPELAGRIELHLAGALTAADRAFARGAFVREHGYLPHAASVALVRSADLLFLPLHDLPPGRRATIVPGKTYEYLASGRPLLAAVPDGDARDLLAPLSWAHTCRPGDVEAMSQILLRVARRRLVLGPAPDCWTAGLERYERDHLTARLAEVLAGAVSSARATRAAKRTLVTA